MLESSPRTPTEPQKLASILTIVACTLTIFAATIVLVGLGPALLFAAISIVAFAAWLMTTKRSEDTGSSILSVYLLVPPLLLALSAARYSGGWVQLLEAHQAIGFNAAFAFTDANWFVLMVCAPVTLTLLGGYLISIHMPAGKFAAWWTAVYAASEGIIQLTLGFSQGTTSFTLLAALLGLCLIGTGLLIAQRLLASKAKTVPEPAPMSQRQRLSWGMLFVAATAIYGVILFNQAGPLPVLIIVGSMLGGLIGWWITTSRVPADPSWSVPLLLLLLTFFYIHVGEEALTDFNGMISEISGVPWADFEFLLLIGLAGPIIWFFAAWSLWNKQPIGNFIFWFLIVGMILGEPTHLLVFPILRMQMLGIGYEYASGMYTALFPMIPAILALVKIIGDHRRRAVLSAPNLSAR
ncbi:MAG: hypothetical protein ACJA0F_000995 [Dinoroseobacter sp.]|jgi:hypothetical protein